MHAYVTVAACRDVGVDGCFAVMIMAWLLLLLLVVVVVVVARAPLLRTVACTLAPRHRR